MNLRVIYRLIFVLLISSGIHGDDTPETSESTLQPTADKKKKDHTFDNAVDNNTEKKENIENRESCKGIKPHLYISDPYICEIGPYFINDTCIRSLDVTASELKSINGKAFDGLPNLERLDLSLNNLTNFFICGGTHKALTTLILRGNRNVESFIDFGSISEKYPELRKLEIRNSRIGGFMTDSSVDLPNLKELDLSCNILNTTENIPKTVKRLYLDDAATELDSSEFESTMFNLEYLSLDDNRHFKILDDPDSGHCCDKGILCLNLPNLRVLSLERCSIKSVSASAFAKMKSLFGLYLRGTNLVPLTDSLLKSAPNLTMLDVSETVFSSGCNLNVLTNLTYLIMDDMKNKSQVMEILEHGLNLSELENFSIQGNELTHVPINTLNNLAKLKDLKLSRNRIKSIQFPIEMPHLQRLEMSHNFVSKIDDISFNNTKRLYHLDIRHNRVRGLDKKSLSNLPSSCYIHLS